MKIEEPYIDGRNEIYKQDFINAVEEILKDKLTSREFKVITSRFGLLNELPKTLEQVGLELKVTRERVRQIQNKALTKLRKSLNSYEFVENYLGITF